MATPRGEDLGETTVPTIPEYPGGPQSEQSYPDQVPSPTAAKSGAQRLPLEPTINGSNAHVQPPTTTPVNEPSTVDKRYSGRNRRPPAWHKDYETDKR